MGKIPDEASPCGVFCGACPSFGKSCRGCGSEDIRQKRKSKFGCTIRCCCFTERSLSFCYECTEFPCKKILKLYKSHPQEKKFDYRREIMTNLERIRQTGAAQWVKEEKQKWTCPQCGGRVRFYYYTCPDCGYRPEEFST